MPIPPLPTLEAADAIDQYPQPDRMNTGMGIAPPPLPGTGKVQTGEVGIGFSENYRNQVLGAKEVKDPAHLNMFSGEDVYSPRYPSVMPGEDSEESFGKAQPWYDKWANATVKMLGTAAGTFVNGIAAIPDGIAGLKSGKNPYETPEGTSIDKWLNNLENDFPNYYTKWETAHPFLSAIPFTGGGANFWSDKFLKNLGFTIGAIGGAVAQDAVVGLATEGVGEIPMVGAQIGKAALWLNKVFTGADKAGELLQLGRQAGRTGQQLLDLRDLAQAAAATKVTNGARWAMNLYGAAASEAGFEARDGYTTVKKDLTDDYIKANGYAPIDKEADDIEKSAVASGNVRFGINMALLSASDAINFGNMLKPFSAAKAGYRGALQKELEEGVGHVGLKKGSLDEFERVTAKTTSGKIWDAVKPYVPAFLSEGVYEEGGQYAAQVGTQNYYERKYLYEHGAGMKTTAEGREKGGERSDKYDSTKVIGEADTTDWDARDTVNNILHSIGVGFGGEFGTQEGLENIFLGALTGVFSAGVEHFMDRKENAAHRKEILDLLNKQGVTGTIKNMYDSTVTAQRISRDMQEAAAKGDIFKYKNFQHEQFVNFILSGVAAGRFDLRIEQLNLLKDMPQDDFKKAFGIDKTEDNQKTVNEYVDSLKDKARNIKRVNDLIDETFQNPYNFRKKVRNDEDQLENEKSQEFEGWKDQLTQLSSVIGDVSRRTRSISDQIRKIDGYLSPAFIRELTNRDSVIKYRDTLEERLKTLSEALNSKSSVDRRGDGKHAALLTRMIGSIDKELKTPTEAGNNKLFEELLNYQLNGETTDDKIQAPRAAIQQLIKMGIDLNRLDVYKQATNDAFEILSSKKGFDKYFSDMQAAKNRAAEAQKAAQQATPVTPTPATPPTAGQPTPAPTTPIVGTPTPTPVPVPTPPPVERIEVNWKDRTRVWNKGEDYWFPTDKGTEKFKVVGGDKDNLVLQRADGSQITIPAETLFEADRLGEEIDQAQSETASTDDTPPPADPTAPINKRGESKKDLAWGMTATTDPPYDLKTTPDDNYQRRHQNFLFNMGSQDSKVFNQNNKPFLRIVPVTSATEEAMGFPKGWITEEGGIRGVYIAQNTSTGQAVYVDGKGEYLGKVGESVDPSKSIYTNLATSDLRYGELGNQEDRYTNKQNLDPDKVAAWWEQERQQLLSISDMNNLPVYQFQISRGIPNEVDPNVRNSVIDTGLMREEDLDKPVVEILTLGNVAVAGALNSDGEGISSHKTSVNMGDMGKAIFNYGGNMIYLDPRKLTNLESRNIFNLIKLLSDRGTPDKKAIFDYLHKIIYMPNIKTGQTTTAGSVTISGSNLYLGTSKTPILMSPENIEANKDQIVAFLEGTFHNTRNKEILKIANNPKASDLEFNELTVKDGKVEIARKWTNYNHYLLSSRTPEGTRRDMPLSTKIVRPQEGEVPMIQKYSVLQGPEMDTKLIVRPQAADQSDTDKLKALGWTDQQIAKMSPGDIATVLRTGLTAEENRKMAAEAAKQQGVTPAPEIKAPEVKTAPRVEAPKTSTTNYRSLLNEYNRFASLSNPSQETVEELGNRILADKAITDQLPSEWLKSKNPGTSDAYWLMSNAASRGELRNILSSLADKAVEATETIKQEVPQEEPRVVDTITLGDAKFAVANVERDEKGNITDFDVLGLVNEDGTVKTPSKPTELKIALLSKVMEGQMLNDLSTETPAEKKSLKDRLADKNRKKGPDSQYRLAPVINPGSYTAADMRQELAETQAMIPGVPVQLVDHLLKVTGGGYAWGKLEKGLIHIYKEAEVGTLYHEAFEAVWGHFLNGKEQRELYNELTSREGSFRTYEGITKPFSQATVQEAKEQMAEEFRDYKMEAKPTPRNAIQRFFQRVLDFIRRFILGDRSKINQVFKKLNRGDYRGFTTSLRDSNEPGYRRIGFENFSESQIQDMLQGMTVEMFMDIFKENQDIIVQLEENPEKGAQELYSKLKDKLSHYFESEDNDAGDTLEAEYAGDGGEKWAAMTPQEQDIAEQQIYALRDAWGKVKTKWDAFVKEHKNYLKVFNVEYHVDDEGNISIAEDEYQEEMDKSQSEYDRDIFQVDAKQSASTKIKLLIATIADSFWKQSIKESLNSARTEETVINRNNSEYKLAKQAQYAKLFNYMLHNLSNINGIYDMWDKMRDMIKDPTKRKKIDANMKRIMNRLNLENGFKGMDINQMKMILAFENTMSKQKPAFFRQFVDQSRKVFLKTSTLNSKLSQVKTLWTAGMMASKAVYATNDGRFKFSKDVVGITDNLKFLNKIGIPIEKAEYDRLRGKDLTKFNGSVNKMRGVIEKSVREDRYIPVMSSREVDFNSRMDEIAELYISNITGDDSQSQHPNLDNEPTSNFVLGNYVATVISDANNSVDSEGKTARQDFMNKIDNQYFNDIFHHDSILLGNILFNPDGTKSDRQVEVGVMEGRQSWNGDNKSSSNLTEAERQVQEINTNLNGIFYTLLPADAKTEWAINVGTYLSAPKFFGDQYGRRDEITKFSSIMYQWLDTEVELARDYESRKHVVALNRKENDREVGKSLRFFKDILDKEIVDRINREIIDGGKTLDTVITEPELRERLTEFIKEKVYGTLNNLVDWNLIDYSEKEGSYKLNGFDGNFISEHIGDKKEHTEEEVVRLLAFREMNYVINNIEMHKFFFGDPAQYKDELKRIKSFLSGREATHVDTIGTDEGFNQVANQELNKVSKTGPMLKLGDPGYHQFKNHFNTFTLRDVEYHSSKIDQIEKAIGAERADPYKRGNEADAQAWMMPGAYREAMTKAGGSFTRAQEEYYQWAHAWERQDKAKEGLYTYTDKELEKADKELMKQEEPNPKEGFPILKLVHSGIQTEDNVAITSLDKASWAPLFYKWYKGTTLGNLYNSLQSKGVDYVRMESAHKVGIQSESLTTLYNDEGGYNKEGVDKMQDEHISLKQLGVQVRQSKKEKGQTEGSQLRKQAIGDLRSNGVPLDFLKGRDEDEAFSEWNQMTKEEKLAASPIYQKINRHNLALDRLTRDRTEQTMNRLGVKKEGNNYTIPDKKKVSDFIKEELERRELPRNIAYGLDVIYGEDGQTSEFVQPLEANAQYTKIRSIIYSVMQKTIMRPKVSGGQKTMLSVTGFEKGKRVVKETINGKPVYTSDTLKFYNVGKDGTEACEVMIPYWFGKKLMQMESGRTKEEVIKYLNETEEGKKLLSGIGFRIPTQGLNSVDFFTVKDFLPEQMGDVIVLPSEITAKAGSDFDIDKLNTYLRNFYVDNKTGYPVAVKWQGDPMSTRKYAEQLLDSGNVIEKSELEALNRYMAEELDYQSDFNMDDLISAIPGVNDLFSEEVITRDFLENRRERLIGEIYNQALQNEYFDSIEDLLKLPENYSRLVQPNDASQLKEDRTYIKGLIAKREGEGDQNLGNYGKLLDSKFMMQERHAYLMSKGVVGPSAVSQTAHATSQNLDGGLVITDPTIVARFPHNEINGRISLSGLTISGSEQLISNVNSQTTDGGVDVAKDKFLAEMGLNKDTLTTYLAIRRMGAPRRWAELFINQPAIQHFLKLQAINNSVSQINPRIKKVAPWKLTTDVYSAFGYNLQSKKQVEAFMANKPPRYTKEEMADAISSKELTAAQKRTQLYMLDDYLKYNNVAWDLFHFYQGYNYDTARLTDPNETRFKKLKFRKANRDLRNQRNAPSISSVGKVMTDTFIGSMKESAESLDAALRSLINVQSGAAGTVLDDIAEDIFNTPGLTAYDRSQIMMAAETSMVDYAIQTNGQINGKPFGSYTGVLLMGDKSVARYIDAIKNSQDSRLVSNPFIQTLVALLDKRKDFASTVQLGERDYDTYTSNVWTDAFRELKDDTTIISINDNPADDRTVAQIYKNLVMAAIIQSGSKKTSTSLSHLIPNETYSDFTKDALRNLHMEGFYENNVLYRTNWNNDKLVPIVDPIYDELDLLESYYPFFIGANADVVNNIKELVGDKPAGILNVEAWKYGKYKVIKIKETHDEVTGERFAMPLVRLFERVDVQDIEGRTPLTLESLPKNVLFKEINAWGDGNRIQEYHDNTTESILPNNFKVNEVTNDQLIYALTKAGHLLNIADDTVDMAVTRLGLDRGGEDLDESGNPEPGPSTDPITDMFGPEKNLEPDKDLDECGGTNFSIKNQDDE